MIPLPTEYRRYLRLHGATKAITVGPPGYFELWAIDEVDRMNKQYGLEDKAPGLVGIGTDGAGEMIAFDQGGAVFMVAIAGMDSATPEKIASSWTEVAGRIK